MVPSVTAASLLSADERAAIAEIEATTSILQLVTRLTGMRFAGIAKFSDADWVVCSAHDTGNMGIHVDDVLDLETTLCSEFCINPQALFIPHVSEDGRYASRPVVKQYAIESYAGAPIFLPDGRLFGALCALLQPPKPTKRTPLMTTGFSSRSMQPSGGFCSYRAS